jgi:hypothetical protein
VLLHQELPLHAHRRQGPDVSLAGALVVTGPK